MWGETFKCCRLSKGISQSTACLNLIDRSTLSKFENNEIMLRFDTVVLLLSQIGFSIEEYILMENGIDSLYENIIEKFNLISNNSNVDDYFIIVDLCNSYLKKVNNPYIVKIRCLSQLMICISKSESLDDLKMKSAAKLVWEEIKNFDMWSVDDVLIINFILFFFEKESLLSITDEILKKLVTVKNFEKKRTLEIGIYINLSYIYIENNKEAEALKILKHALHLSLKINRCDYIAICYARIGIITTDNSLFSKSMSLLKLTDNHTLIKVLQEEKYSFEKLNKEEFVYVSR